MPTYDNPIRQSYSIPTTAFGATTATRNIIGPKGMRGLVVDAEVDLTADCVGTTAVPEIDVGSASGLVEYARFRLGSAPGTGYAAGMHRATQKIGAANVFALSDFAGHVALRTAEIPADTAVVMTAKQGSGGSPAGTGSCRVEIDWFN